MGNNNSIMTLSTFFKTLADVFDGDLDIERIARKELQSQTSAYDMDHPGGALPAPLQEVMRLPDAHPVCADILDIAFNWAPPETSSDPLYQKDSTFKSHVELLGPDGLIKSDIVRIGLYGMLSHSEYGLRTHPAEEIFIMLAGDCLWKRGDAPYSLLTVNGRSHHPSYLPHATKTQSNAFMSVYVWHGDLSTNQYVYSGRPPKN